MFGVDGSYGQVVAFIAGMEEASDGRLLVSFDQWLIARLGGGSNLRWPGLVIYLAFPEMWQAGYAQALSEEQSNHAADTLFDLLQEFLSHRNSLEAEGRSADGRQG